MKYHIWTEGCQMNVADSQRISESLERLGYESTTHPAEADVIVMNTCVVRQSAEDKALGRLSSLRPIKKNRPDVVINLMGCLVGTRGSEVLRRRFPYVDVFSPPSDPSPLMAYLKAHEMRKLDENEVERRYAMMDEETAYTLEGQALPVAGFIPIVYGCSHACTYCVIPYRRGAERSRPPQEIFAEAKALTARGVSEITLLGQIVDRYGKDEPEFPNLAGLLRQLHEIDGIERLRFLTSHPNWMTDELLDAVVSLPKVMPHIEVPVQAGDDEVLANMHRGYTTEQYRRLVEHIREKISRVSIATDIIVGFPGESEGQFQHTYDLLADLKLDVAHLARYSPRPDTVSARRMVDDVSDEEKWRRFRALEILQEEIGAEINQKYQGEAVEVLFEEKVKKRWKGRTPTNKLVFVESEVNLRGKVVPVRINWTGPWSMIGEV